jgi:hypothetical protein
MAGCGRSASWMISLGHWVLDKYQGRLRQAGPFEKAIPSTIWNFY